MYEIGFPWVWTAKRFILLNISASDIDGHKHLAFHLFSLGIIFCYEKA